MADPASKLEMDPNYEKQLRALKDAAKDEYEGRKTGSQAKWFRPPGWGGDVFDYEALSTPFSRDKANDGVVDAMKDPKSPGTTGDVVAGTVMIDRLACLERAFRARTTLRRCRAVAHTLARKKGQGDDRGPFIQLGVEYVRSVMKQAKKPAQ